MIKKRISIRLAIELKRINKNGLRTINICATYEGKRYYYSTGYEVTDKQEFDKVVSGKRLTPQQTKLKQALTVQIQAANNIIDELEKQGDYTFNDFISRLIPKKRINLYDFIQSAYTAKIETLHSNNQLKTAQTYDLACKSLSGFKKNLKFEHITPDFLKRYERHMTDIGRSKTTVSMYLRTLRTLFNDGIDLGYIDRARYPFGKRKYSVPAAKNIKKALTIEQISKIYHYKCPNELQQQAKDYWLFLYLNNGMNVKDMALLKQKDYQDGVITFVRAKTATTTKEVEPIQIPVSPDTKEIINKYGKRTLIDNDYLFPILSKKMNAAEQMRAIQQTTQNINKNMAKIATALDIPKVTTYTARHSYATVLLHSGQSIAFIGKQLGHTDTKTTENYLKSFNIEAKRKANEALTNFK